MNNARTTLITLVTAIVLAGSVAPANANIGGLSNGKPKPQVAWDHAKWKQCWKASYIQAREDGHSMNGSTAYADLVCGDPPV